MNRHTSSETHTLLGTGRRERSQRKFSTVNNADSTMAPDPQPVPWTRGTWPPPEAAASCSHDSGVLQCRPRRRGGPEMTQTQLLPTDLGGRQAEAKVRLSCLRYG